MILASQKRKATEKEKTVVSDDTPKNSNFGVTRRARSLRAIANGEGQMATMGKRRAREGQQ